MSSAEAAVGPVGRADALGWASAALGVPMIFVPRRLLETIGVRPEPGPVALTMAVGLRELMATVQLNAMRHRRVGTWARVAGDTMDLALLAAAFRYRRQSGARLIGTLGLVGGILAADLVTARQLDRAEGAEVPDGVRSTGAGARHDIAGGPARVKTAITIAKPEQEIRRAFEEFEWSAFDPRELERSGAVDWVPAPGDRGVELHLDVDPAVMGGALGSAALKLVGRSPDQRISDELRRFKGLVETGVAVRSDKTPEGASSARQIKQRPAQPADVGS